MKCFPVGESSGLKPNRTVAKHIPGPPAPAALEQAGARASTAAGELSRAHMLVLERGDKLSQLEDRTERMSNQVTPFTDLMMIPRGSPSSVSAFFSQPSLKCFINSPFSVQ